MNVVAATLELRTASRLDFVPVVGSLGMNRMFWADAAAQRSSPIDRSLVFMVFGFYLAVGMWPSGQSRKARK